MILAMDFIVCVLIAIALRLFIRDDASYFIACVVSGVIYGALKNVVRNVGPGDDT